MLDTKKYASDCMVTCSPNFYGENMCKFVFAGTVARFIEVANDLDAIKKGVFYGKAMPLNCAPEMFSHRLETENAQALHGIIGVATEAGELCERIFNEADDVNIKEEIGDILWYLAILCEAKNITLEECANANIAKLKMRYGDKFSNRDALERNLVAERSILENVPVGNDQK